MKVLLRISCCLLLLGSLLPEKLNAQPKDLRFEHITLEDGLPETGTIDILQDRQGFLWLAMWNGLVRYDGYDFTSYKPDPLDATSITEGNVFALHEDRSGTLWVGTCGGLNQFDRATGRFIRYQHNPDDPNSLSSSCVNDIYEDRQGFLWVTTLGDGVNRFDRETGVFTHFRHDPSDSTTPSSNWIDTIYEDRSGTLWMGTANGINRFDPATETFTRFLHNPEAPGNPRIDIQESDTYPENNVHVIDEDRAGVLWLGTLGGGLCRFERDAETFACYRHDPDDPRSINGDIVFAFAEDSSGGFWVGTMEGLNRFDRATETFTRYQHAPAGGGQFNNRWITKLYVDHAGILWIGTAGGTLSRVDLASDAFTYHRTGYQVLALYEGRDDFLWIGSGEGLQRLDRSTGATRTYRHDPADPQSLSGNFVSSIYEDRSGTLWVGTSHPLDSPLGQGGLHRFDRERGTFTRFLHDPDNANSLSDGGIDAIYEDRSGALWAGGDGLNRLDRETGAFTHYRHDPNDPRSLSSNDINTIYEDLSGMLWIGTQAGLNRFDPSTDSFVRFLHDPDDPKSLGADWVASVYEDSHGVLWVDLSRFDRATETFTHYDIQEKAVVCLLGDDEGRLWMSTFRGLAWFDPQTETFTHYGIEKGVDMYQFAHGSTCHKGRHGELFFSGRDGFYAFSPDRFRDNSNPPHIVLTDLRIFDESILPGEDERLPTHISEAEALTLRHSEHDLSIDFVGLHYSRPEANRYAYMLEPYDTDWREAGAQQRTVRYTNLDPGDYVFRVKAANVYGVWNDEGATLRITITPPWWKTAWAYVLYLMGLGLLIFIGHEARVHRLKAHALKLGQEVAERTEELVAEKKTTEEQARRLSELDEAKNRFFANISHEFRTPLTLILGPIQDAIDGTYGRFDPGFERQLGTLRRNAHRLLRLINQLLDLSKLEAGKMEITRREADLVPFLQKLVQSFLPMAERGQITLHFQSEIESLRLGFDPDVLEKVFSNLLANALAFTPAGGKVWVTMNRREGDKASTVEVIVKDTGPGIAKEDLARIFDRFQQADTSTTRLHEGTGIGLALVKELVDLHEGTVLVKSEPGFGSAFIVRISSSGEKEIIGRPVDTEVERTKREVLIVDGKTTPLSTLR